jgi:hypothetical protein
MRFLGWVLRNSTGQAHSILIISDSGVLVELDRHGRWTVDPYGDFDDAAAVLQQRIAEREVNGYQVGGPLTMERRVQASSLENCSHDKLDIIFKPYLEAVGGPDLDHLSDVDFRAFPGEVQVFTDAGWTESEPFHGSVGFR